MVCPCPVYLNPPFPPSHRDSLAITSHNYLFSIGSQLQVLQTFAFLKLNMQFQYVLIALLASTTQILAIPTAEVQETAGTSPIYLHNQPRH